MQPGAFWGLTGGRFRPLENPKHPLLPAPAPPKGCRMALPAGEMPNRVTEVPPPPPPRGTEPSEENRRRAVHAGALETGPTTDMRTPEMPLPPPPKVQGHRGPWASFQELVTLCLGG